MKYSELIRELDFWKELMDDEDPEVVINSVPTSYKIINVQPVMGIENRKAIGVIFNEQNINEIIK